MLVKKLLFLFTLLFSFSLSPVLKVQAVDVIPKNVCEENFAAEKPSFCEDITDGSDDTNPIFGPNGVMTVAINVMSYVLGIIATIILVISGISFMTSQGNPGSITKQRNRIIYALVGIVVAILAQSLVLFVLKRI